jgi:hypothetical protein
MCTDKILARLNIVESGILLGIKVSGVREIKVAVFVIVMGTWDMFT